MQVFEETPEYREWIAKKLDGLALLTLHKKLDAIHHEIMVASGKIITMIVISTLLIILSI